jgi:hypothetical protein
MRISETITGISAVIILLSLTLCPDALAGDAIAADVLQPYVNRIIWVNWHSGSMSFESEGTLKEVIGNNNCISLAIRTKFPGETIKFEGDRILYINLSAIDAFEIRKPK